MAQRSSTWWQRNKFCLSGLILILPFIFLYQSMNPKFPDAWGEKTVGEFKITPMPFNMDPPYSHHDEYVKDFLLMFGEGDIKNIRQAYFSLGEAPHKLSKLALDEEGILHGSRHGQHVHAIAPPAISAKDKAWLIIETWQGDVLTQSWDIPQALVTL
ncbi:hypothetical protein N7931_06255 [Catenovulum sp. 2E275]|uniref:hypothetical protein n=1 Tax=Catenovulum sp. 2E275 TaxID=2980497 RepID=UPI0021D1B022|nr:hypothetical protein [Catenovulum sp. 2E275]MCU4675232.1 hypothetical protein [Catenovulum sp. 2E275]